jgi:hypothetical protein
LCEVKAITHDEILKLDYEPLYRNSVKVLRQYGSGLECGKCVGGRRNAGLLMFTFSMSFLR